MIWLCGGTNEGYDVRVVDDMWVGHPELLSVSCDATAVGGIQERRRVDAR